jgi:hypothetical protein
MRDFARFFAISTKCGAISTIVRLPKVYGLFIIVLLKNKSKGEIL